MRNTKYAIRTTSKRNHVLDSGGLLIDLDDLVARRHAEVSRHALIVSFARLPDANRMIAEHCLQFVEVGCRGDELKGILRRPIILVVEQLPESGPPFFVVFGVGLIDKPHRSEGCAVKSGVLLRSLTSLRSPPFATTRNVNFPSRRAQRIMVATKGLHSALYYWALSFIILILLHPTTFEQTEPSL